MIFVYLQCTIKFNIMFGIITEKKVKNEVEKLNSKLDEMESEFYSFLEDSFPDEKFVKYFWWRHCYEPMSRYDADSIMRSRKFKNMKDVAAYIDDKIKRRHDLIEELKKDASEKYAVSLKNKEALNSWEGRAPLFFTLTDLYREDRLKTYCMCYEFKKIGDGRFEAFVFTDGTTEGYVYPINYYEEKLERMTEDEFERYYIMGRMKCTNYSSEIEAIEYNNSIRRLFHGQTEID